MDFGFIRSSTEDYKRPNKYTDRVVLSYDGHSAYLLVVDGASRYVWCFLTKSKEPPIDIIRAFMPKYGIGSGVVRTDQGGELARSNAFRDIMLKEFGYVVEPTGADSPSQNGGVERYNNTLAVIVRTLLYGSGLPARFWSAALLHATYLHNRRVHSATHKTPFKGWHGRQPDVANLKTFGARVCVKRTGSRRSKLDRHDFTGIFLGFTATDQNIIYLDSSSGVVKSCHHAVFDEAWYLQLTRPPAAQLLYDLGLEADTSPINLEGPISLTPIGTITLVGIPWPPSPPLTFLPKKPPPASLFAPLPLRVTAQPNQWAAAAARVKAVAPNRSVASDIVSKFLIGPQDMAMIYMSPDPYGRTFEKDLDLRKWNLTKHRTAGMQFLDKDGRLVLTSIDPSTPAARIDRWRTHLRGAWLISVDGTPVHNVTDVEAALARQHSPTSPCTLVFSHPEISPDISSRGLPIMSKEDFSQFTHDQLNNHLDLLTAVPPSAARRDTPSLTRVTS